MTLSEFSCFDLKYIDGSFDSGALCIALTCVKTFVPPDAFDVASLVIIIIFPIIRHPNQHLIIIAIINHHNLSSLFFVSISGDWPRIDWEGCNCLLLLCHIHVQVLIDILA